MSWCEVGNEATELLEYRESDLRHNVSGSGGGVMLTFHNIYIFSTYNKIHCPISIKTSRLIMFTNNAYFIIAAQ